MITTAIFLLLLGLIVFGPKKTIEMAQAAGEVLGKVKRATGQLEWQLSDEVRAQDKGDIKTRLAASVPERTQSGTPMPR